jgi:hypothetical protein
MAKEYNTKLDKNIENFILYRIEGKSFDEIAIELKTSKQTLIEWNKKEIVRSVIADGKAFKLDSLVSAYKFDLSNRIETYLELSNKINTELLARDLKEIATETLLKMSISNDSRVYELIKDKRHTIGTPSLQVFEYTESKDSHFILAPDE